MKILKYLLIVIILVSCNESQISYKEAMEECMQNVTVNEFSLENGKKGASYIGYDINCIKGAQLPIFDAETLYGKKIGNKDLIGRINVINFWFEACRPCVAEMPGLNKIATCYKDEEVNFLAISTDETTSINKFLAKNKFNFSHLANGKEIIQNKFHHKSSFPITIVTDKNLKIIEVISGGGSDSAASEEIVNKLKPIIEQLLI